MKIIPVIAALTLCLAASAAMAQTPAQDEATVAADKQARDDAKSVVQADTLQLDTDQKSGNNDAAQADTNKLITDKQALDDAEHKLRADRKDLYSDEENFNGNQTEPLHSYTGNNTSQ
jgi:hypothetical protein